MSEYYEQQDDAQGFGNGWPCEHCGEPGHEHDKIRVTPADGPPGSWHYRYRCPGGSNE